MTIENITYTNVRNPKWLNLAKNFLECEVNFDHLPDEWVGFSCVASGDLPHTHEIYARCVSGEFGEIADFVVPSWTTLDVKAQLATQRDIRIADDVDPISKDAMVWSSLSADKQQEWIDYRAALVALTDQAETATLVWNDETRCLELSGAVYPTKPA